MNEPKAIDDQTWSADGEIFHCDTLGELIDNYGDDLEVGAVVYVGQRVDPDPTKYFDADDVIERLNEVAYDNCGESAEDWPAPTDAAKAELNEFLAAWITKHCQTHFYSVRSVEPYTLTAEDLAETSGPSASAEQKP